jgi:thiamine-monophosphate kinase
VGTRVGTRVTDDVPLTGPTRFRPHQALGTGREFDTIRALMARWGDLVADIGDDAAVLPPVEGVHVISTDACVEDVHFRREWMTPREIGVRAAAAALSDLAAMGATAGQVLVAFVVPEPWQAALLDIAEGLAEPIRAAGARIIGGNLSRGATLGITLTVIGDALRPVPRSGARPGELVVVTGQLGGPGAATAMLDISDGLAADARHLGAASGCTLTLDPSRVPCGPGVVPAAALVSGEEYELLATIPEAVWPALKAQWAAQSDVPLTVIGRVEPLGTAAQPADEVAHAGHDHFAR